MNILFLFLKVWKIYLFLGVLATGFIYCLSFPSPLHKVRCNPPFPPLLLTVSPESTFYIIKMHDFCSPHPQHPPTQVNVHTCRCSHRWVSACAALFSLGVPLCFGSSQVCQGAQHGPCPPAWGRGGQCASNRSPLTFSSVSWGLEMVTIPATSALQTPGSWAPLQFYKAPRSSG